MVILVPFETIQALKENNITAGVRSLRIEAHSPQTKYLLNEMKKIETAKTSDKEIRNNYRELYHTGIAYHNLYLFLRGEGITSEDFSKEAIKYYKRALKTKSPYRKNQISLTMAALYASDGNQKMSDKYFKKVNEAFFDDDFRKYLGYALYYASKNDTENAILNLEAAYNINEDYTKFWLGISDDFTNLYSNPLFQEKLKKWKVVRLNRGSSIYDKDHKHLVH